MRMNKSPPRYSFSKFTLILSAQNACRIAHRVIFRQFSLYFAFVEFVEFVDVHFYPSLHCSPPQACRIGTKLLCRRDY